MNTTRTVRGHREEGRGYRERGEHAEQGQTTAEYALVLLAAGTIAMLVVTWARGENAIAELFDLMLTEVTSLVE